MLIGVPTPEFPEDEDDSPHGRRSRPAVSAHKARAIELARQRLANARGEGPPPEVRPAGAALGAISKAMS